MPCPECEENHQRALRAEVAERSLLLFTKTFSKLSQQLWDIEQEIERRRAEEAPDGAQAIPKPRCRIVLIGRPDEDYEDKSAAATG